MVKQASAFTGRTRGKKTPWIVKSGDAIAQRLITVGGIGTIVAVCLVFVYLFFVVAPLFDVFHPPSLNNVSLRVMPSAAGERALLWLSVNEYRTMAWELYPNGRLRVFRLDNGQTLEERALFAGRELTAISTTIEKDDVLLGFADGSVCFGRIGFRTFFPEPAAVPEPVRDLVEGDVATLEADNAVVERTPLGRFRAQSVTSTFEPTVQVAQAPIRLLDHLPLRSDDGAQAPGAKEYTFVCYAGDGTLQYVKLAETENAFTLQKELQAEPTRLPLPPRDGVTPLRALLTKRGDNVYFAWQDGRMTRFDTRNLADVSVLEEVELLAHGGRRLTVCDFILGRETILCGDAEGGLHAWFRTRNGNRGEGDGFYLTRVHDLPSTSVVPTVARPSQRSRMVAVGYADGHVRVFHVTSRQQVVACQIPGGEPVAQVLIAPKDDGLFARAADQVFQADLDAAHPEATLGALFLPVWYEGYSGPQHMWQSSFADVGPEMKLGLMPLIFGTIKATVYTMLFGSPLALLAAIFTSEFLPPRWRGRIKPVVEMMASLPSVVLGFLAALVFAPIVEQVVPAALACFVVIPLSYLASAFLWQLLPHKIWLRLSRYRFLFMCLVFPAGFIAAYRLGPWLEQLLFAGDIKLWLIGQRGSGFGAWLLLLLPVSALLTFLLTGLIVNPLLRRWARAWPRTQFAILNMLKFAVAVALTFGCALLLAWLMTAIGWDPRGSFVGKYDPRNALIVGFVMGFAVIPIIYTIADDALTTVPDHLRSASLGCGATPWQTAIRIVIPTAMSGLFSALMIGLGRSVGETMIVLMAAGNTPLMDWNIFNGFRTLSANIAVELPEAVRDSTHYRTLFLAALTLFILTFFINTLAEIVRLRFRKRAYQL